jgi:hypothetical protein
MKQKLFNRAIATAGLLVILAASMSAGTPIRLSFRDTTIVGGTALSYPLYVDSSLTGYAVSSYEIQFTYNTSGFTFVGATSNGCIDSAWSTTAFEISAGTIRIAGAGTIDLAGKGKLIVLQFVSKIFPGPYNSYFSFSFQSSTFNQGTPTSNNYRNGTVTLTPLPTITVSPDTWLATKGETRQYSVSGGKVPYTWGSTVPSVATIDAAGLLTAVSAGFTRVFAADSAGIADTTNLVEVRSFRLSFRDTSRYQGQTLDLPIYTTDLTGLNVQSGQFTITFDNSKWTVDSVVTAGTLLSPFAPVTYSKVTGSVSVSFAGSTPITGSGILLYLRMRASSINAYGSTFAFQNVLFNQDLLANVGTGYMNVLPLATINVSPPYQQILVAGDSLQFSASGGAVPYTWSVSDPSCASINSLGWLKAKKSGTVTVKVLDTYGGSGTSGNVVIYDFRLNVPDTVLIPSSFVEVPLYVTANALGFISYQGTFTYSTNTFVKLVDLVSTGTLSAGFSINSSDKNGVVTFAAAGVNSVTSGGILIKLKFAVPDSTPRPSTTYITLSNVKFDQGTPLALTKNGSFQIATASVFSNSPSSVSLHSKVGQQDSAAITVFNKGTANLTSTIGVIGPSVFTTSKTNINVVPGDSAKVYVFFNPLSLGAATATIRFTTNDPYHSTVDIPVTGATPYPIIGFNILSFNFGTVKVGQYKDTTVTISNTGTDTLKITNISSTAGSFTATPTVGIIPPGQSMIDTLRFIPSVSGFVLGRIFVTSNSLTSPNDTVGVSGTGYSLFPVLVFSSSNIIFGSVKVGSYKDTTVTISNTGTDTLKISNVTASIGVFTGRPTTRNIPPGQSFVDTLRFSPSSVGVFTGRVFVASNALKNPDTITVSGTGTPATGVEDGSLIPATFVLEQNFPNPFNPSTTIRYGLQARSTVRLEVYSILGQKIEELVTANLEPGFYSVTWKASVPSGMYFYKLEAVALDKSVKSFRQVRKMTLMK